MSQPEVRFPLGRTARLAVFASGAGSNLASLLRAFPPTASNQGALAEVALVVSDRPGCGALDLAKAAGVRTVVHPFKPDRASFEAHSGAALASERIDAIALAGFMRILSPAFTSAWRGRLLNVHPSLLPKHPGLNAVKAALAAGDRVAGCSVHWVDAGVDTGPVLAQAELAVLEGDTEASLHDRIRALEHRLYPATLQSLFAGAFEDQRGRL
jgi:phosphoribosylglycinamide formyltransferase-1